MKKIALFILAGAIVAGLAPVASAASGHSGDLAGKNVVLVHGAFADGSSWAKVIPLLEAKGLHVTAVQNPLSSLDDDVAATRRTLEQQKGPVVLVGHSWGGVVITEAGNAENVKALVYVAAFAPDSGQSVNDLGKGLPPPPWASVLVKDSGNFLTLPATAIHSDFAQDLKPAEADLVAATQGPWAARCGDDKVTKAAWHDRSVWSVIPGQDRMIPPALQEKQAKAMHSTVMRASGSHVIMLSNPTLVADTIIKAAEAIK